MADDRAEMYRHVDAAIRELTLAARAGGCGTCADLLGVEAAHLEMFRDLSGKVVEFTDRQRETTEELGGASRRADTALGVQRIQPTGERSGLGIVDMATDIWRTRVRVTDVLTLGGRR